MPDTPPPPQVIVSDRTTIVNTPNYNGFASRVMLFGGLMVIFGAIALAAFVKGISAWVVLGLAVIGGALIPNAKMVELVNAWRAGRAA